MKKIIYILIGIFLITTFISCDEDFLDQADPDSLTSDAFWRNETDALAGLASAYANIGAVNFWDITEVNAVIANFRSDLCIPGPDSWNYPDWASLSTFTNTSGNSRVSIFWEDSYRGLFNTNQVIENVGLMTSDKINDELKSQIIAEAKFLRAFLHFRLLNYFDKIILIDGVPHSEDDLEKELSEREEVWTLIEQDLTDAALELPITQPDANIGRATRGAALAYKGKAHLYQKEYTDAVIEFQKVLDLNVYDLNPNFINLFDGSDENSIESIFEIQYSSLKTNDEWLGHVYGKFTSPGELGGWGNIEASQRLLNYMLSEGEVATTGTYDSRLYWTLFFNDPSVDVFGQSYTAVFGAASNRVIFKKYMRSDVPEYDNGPWQTSMNTVEFRFADLLLMMAEALNESGSTGLAYSHINNVRNRANMNDLTSGLSQEQMRNRIIHERIMELAYEGHRFFDLRRWDILETTMQNSGKQGAGNFSSNQHAFFPIPDTETNTNSAIK